MNYKYQTHTHTKPCSRCSGMTPEMLIDALRQGGYQGTVLTNHFTGGNTGISRDAEWADFVREYEKDYEKCVEAAKPYGLDVIFGIEEHIKGGLEVLIYGITPKILYRHPELRAHTYEVWKGVALENDLVLIQAHPYRERPYITTPGVMPLDFIDGIEVYNYCNVSVANLLAWEYSRLHPDLILTSGADSHGPDNACFGGISSDRRIRNEEDLKKILKSGEYNLILGETN